MCWLPQSVVKLMRGIALIIGFLGGTGREGTGLALRFGMADKHVMIGSRKLEKARQIAGELETIAPDMNVSGDLNEHVAALSDIIFVTVPCSAHDSLLSPLTSILKEKIVVSTGSDLEYYRDNATTLTTQTKWNSVAEEIQYLLPESMVVSAFQNLSAADLLDAQNTLYGDVVVCSDHNEAKVFIMGLINLLYDLKPIDGGDLCNSRYVEAMTWLLININSRYKIRSKLKIIGIP